jgi:hypothetical protein
MQKIIHVEESLACSEKFCSECDKNEPAQTFCASCQTYLCKDHSITHKKEKRHASTH